MLKDIPTNTREATPDRIKAILAKTLRVAIYCRVSTDIQEEQGTSLDSQLENAIERCNKKGYVVDERYIYKESFTGTLYRERPVLSILREDAKNHRFDVVIVYALDRLSRVLAHQIILMDEFEQLGIMVESITEEIDNTLSGKIVRATMGIVAEVEHEKILERTQRGKRNRVNSGRMPGLGPLTYGYDWDDAAKKQKNRYIINEEEKKVVERIFKLAKQGYSLHLICKLLNDENIPTKSGKGFTRDENGKVTKTGKGYWSRGMVNRILRNRAYIGEAYAYKWEYIKAPNGKKLLRQRLFEEWVRLPDGLIPPIIDRETFEVVQEILDRNKEEASRNNKDPEDTLLRCGYVICGNCGSRMTVNRCKPNPKWHSNGQINYVCLGVDAAAKNCNRNKIVSHFVDDAAWEKVGETIHKLSLVTSSIDELKEVLKSGIPQKGELKPIETSIRKVQEVQNSLVNDLKSPHLKGRSRELVLEELGNLENILAQLEEDRQKVINDKIEWAEVEDEIDNLLAWCIELRGTYENASYAHKRKAIRMLGIKVVVNQNGQNPRYNVLVTAPNIVSRIS